LREYTNIPGVIHCEDGGSPRRALDAKSDAEPADIIEL
jgi:hypothetical protein